MGAIATSDARAEFTKMLIEVYRERNTPTSFGRSYFPSKVSSTKYVSIEVQRGTEKVAVDVTRGVEGNRNKFATSSEKIFEPPYYREYFDCTEIDLYDRMWGTTEIDAGIYSQFLDETAERLMMIQYKIDRAYELQCWQVLEDGIVQLTADANIDFKRKAGSLVDVSGSNPWSTATNDPFTDLADAAAFLRKTGKAQGNVFDAILGAEAMSNLLQNTVFIDRGNLRRVEHVEISAPQANSVGGVLHGQITAGSYRFNLWTYPQYYDLSGTSTPYFDDKKVIVLPQNPRFTLAFAAVPQLIDPNNPMIERGEYIVSEYMDQRLSKHEIHIKSAGIAIPVAVDQMYTVQVIA